MPVTIRPSEDADLPRLAAIEVAAGAAFATVGMPEVADDEPFTEAELAEPHHAGRLWVAADGDEVVGYLLARVVAQRGHVEQVSVVPTSQGSGIGRALIDRAADWAATQGFTQLSLSTFRDVPWNAPLYAHLGFRVLDEHELDDELLAEREAERLHGLDVDARVFMVRPVTDLAAAAQAPNLRAVPPGRG